MGVEDSPTLFDQVLVIARSENLDPGNMTVTYEEAPHSLLTTMKFCVAAHARRKFCTDSQGSIKSYYIYLNSAFRPGSGGKFAIDVHTQYVVWCPSKRNG
jgi:hypothetical protein